MDRITLSPSLEVSRIVYGMWRIGDDTDTSPARVTAKIEACLEQGITTFDQADIYGEYTAEAVLGGALMANPSLRAKMQIVTKCDIVAPCGKYSDVPVKYYDTSAAHIHASVDASLTDMGIDHIDLLLIHRPDPFMDHHETGTALDAVIASGKVGNIGVSNFRPWDWELLQSGMKSKLVTNQIEVSLGAHEGLTNGDIAFHQKNGSTSWHGPHLGAGH
jgi:predicted oxidoreductase